MCGDKDLGSEHLCKSTRIYLEERVGNEMFKGLSFGMRKKGGIEKKIRAAANKLELNGLKDRGIKKASRKRDSLVSLGNKVRAIMDLGVRNVEAFAPV